MAPATVAAVVAVVSAVVGYGLVATGCAAIAAASAWWAVGALAGRGSRWFGVLVVGAAIAFAAVVRDPLVLFPAVTSWWVIGGRVIERPWLEHLRGVRDRLGVRIVFAFCMLLMVPLLDRLRTLGPLDLPAWGTWVVVPVLGGLAMSLLLDDPSIALVRNEQPSVGECTAPQWVIVAVALVLAAAVVVGIAVQWPLNFDERATDQGAYLNNAADWFGTGGDWNRMPLWPHLARLIVDPSDSRDRQMAQGKAFGVLIGLIGLSALVWLVRRRFGALAAIVVAGIVGSTLVMFKAPAAQADLLSFFILALAAAGCWRTLCTGSVWAGAVTGVAIGFAHLSKANAPVMVVLVTGVALAGVALPTRWSGLSTTTRRRLSGALLALVGMALLTVLPYAVQNHRTNGSPFYNDNTTYFFWADSWPEAYGAVLGEVSPEGIGPTPPTDRPNLSRYVRTHSWRDAVTRLTDGTRAQLDLAKGSYGYGRPLVVAALAAIISVLLVRPRAGGRRLAVVFAAATVVTYQLLMAWWFPIAFGERFALVMFIPAIVCLVGISATLGRSVWLVSPRRAVRLSTVLLGLQLAILLLQLPYLLAAAAAYPGFN